MMCPWERLTGLMTTPNVVVLDTCGYVQVYQSFPLPGGTQAMSAHQSAKQDGSPEISGEPSCFAL
jgi:hypothetical protein